MSDDIDLTPAAAEVANSPSGVEPRFKDGKLFWFYPGIPPDALAVFWAGSGPFDPRHPERTVVPHTHNADQIGNWVRQGGAEGDGTPREHTEDELRAEDIALGGHENR